MNVFRFIPGYEEEIYQAGKEPLLLLLLSFLLSFALTRLYTRLARRHGWGSGRLGDTHVHHMVPGLVLVLVGGLIAFSTYTSPAIVDLAAIAFGAGAALVLDEFALVFHLEDVYWEDEGRQSVVATVLGAAVIVLMLVLTAPAGLHTDTFTDRSRIYAVAYLGGQRPLRADLLPQGEAVRRPDRDLRPPHRPDRSGTARAPEVALGALLLRRGQARAGADVASHAASASACAIASSPSSVASRTAQPTP